MQVDKKSQATRRSQNKNVFWIYLIWKQIFHKIYQCLQIIEAMKNNINIKFLKLHKMNTTMTKISFTMFTFFKINCLKNAFNLNFYNENILYDNLLVERQHLLACNYPHKSLNTKFYKKKRFQLHLSQYVRTIFVTNCHNIKI